jgi:hypothetical protein
MFHFLFLYFCFRNFTHTLNFLYGNCYTFNSIDNVNNQQLFSTRSGATAGGEVLHGSQIMQYDITNNFEKWKTHPTMPLL